MYLIVGGSGFLGRYIIKNILELSQEEIIATYSSQEPVLKDKRVCWRQANVTDVEALKKLNESIAPNTKIIYLAAYHHPDKVEENQRLAWDINIVALANAVNILDKASCFYYSSTDTVYGEGSKNKRFTETDRCAPVNLYGRHKVLAEQICLAKRFNVIRFPFIFGPSLVENRPHFFDKIKSDLEAGKQVEMFSDSYRSTLSFNQCANLLVKLIEKEGACSEKILNISGDTALSKYDAAIMLAERFGLDKSLIIPVSVTQNKAIFKAKRASSAILDNTRIKQILNLDQIILEL